MTIKPLDDRIVVELPESVNESDKSSLIQLVRKHDKVAQSVVVAVGPGKVLPNGKHVPMLFEAGQVVFYPAECETSAPHIKHNDKEYLVLIQDQILCYRPKEAVEAAQQEQEATND